MQDSGAEYAAEQAALTESITLTLTDGEDNQAKVTVEYPKDHAILALRALDTIAQPQYISSILYDLRDDPSVAETLKRAGLSYADDEWDDEDDGWASYDDEEED